MSLGIAKKSDDAILHGGLHPSPPVSATIRSHLTALEPTHGTVVIRMTTSLRFSASTPPTSGVSLRRGRGAGEGRPYATRGDAVSRRRVIAGGIEPRHDSHIHRPDSPRTPS